ncbi:pyruvate dehydrogenase (acetyl-transferring) E1 component subunit alpha [Alteribacter natronophilus]|uniref:pyruvate dehydrogenase (acetyl-transferring) E1 component subunit alpha n=1 Tax=Alteribacter natronophilus TaxID=2583810 RepID=UPI00110EFD52|nr:pyruvate dehydrogenase (acetyl-transferring) E1 component subunit alpha [Alteribacter natronophilus]TMW73073.1 pyruvate dehydrogenase (acetyl-transferring) E1 component subunit alpha [Alteribacter natronophilus]
MEKEFPIRQVLDGEGNITDDSYDLSEELVKDLYGKMLRARTLDKKSVNLQRQGRIGTYAPFEGQEASQVGSASALGEGDWMFPTYRDHGATLTFGHSVTTIMLYWKGRVEGCVPPEGKNIFPPAVPIATQLPHATGAAMAEKRKGTDRVSIAYFGDGATSEGDFHEGLNFASVFKAPVVFFNQNNGYAISVPIEKQMNSKTIAQKSLAYDMDGVRVDGNDVLAVYFETKKAVEKARRGEGPTLIEAVTWRYGAHTTADDPTKYRDQQVSEEKRNKIDPLLRLERYMEKQGFFDEQWKQDVTAQCDREIEQAVEEMEAFPDADINDMFGHVFKEPVWTIEKQREDYLTFKRGETV